jgi:small subunit ribosomal protein S17
MADEETTETPEEIKPDAPETPEAAAETDAPEAAAPAADAAPAEPEPVLDPKERRAARRARTRGVKAQARGPLTPEQRAELRKQKAAQRSRYRAKQKAKRAERPKAEEPELQAPEHGPGRPKVRQGVVVSDKADKTITVRIDYQRRHRKYHKILRSSMTLHAHDEGNDAGIGDTVRVVESRPLSRSKRWRLVEVLEKAK